MGAGTLTTGATTSVTVSVAVPVTPWRVPVTVWTPGVVAVQVAPVHEPSGAMENAVSDVTSPRSSPSGSMARAVKAWDVPGATVAAAGLSAKMVDGRVKVEDVGGIDGLEVPGRTHHQGVAGERHRNAEMVKAGARPPPLLNPGRTGTPVGVRPIRPFRRRRGTPPGRRHRTPRPSSRSVRFRLRPTLAPLPAGSKSCLSARTHRPRRRWRRQGCRQNARPRPPCRRRWPPRIRRSRTGRRLTQELGLLGPCRPRPHEDVDRAGGGPAGDGVVEIGPYQKGVTHNRQRGIRRCRRWT